MDRSSHFYSRFLFIEAAVRPRSDFTSYMRGLSKLMKNEWALFDIMVHNVEAHMLTFRMPLTSSELNDVSRRQLLNSSIASRRKVFPGDELTY